MITLTLTTGKTSLSRNYADDVDVETLKKAVEELLETVKE